MERNTFLQAQHLPGVLNTIADEELSDKSEWRLSPILFQKINRFLGPLSTDLFASRLSSQLPVFVSWRPDPLAVATDAFIQDWNTLKSREVACRSPLGSDRQSPVSTTNPRSSGASATV